MAPPKKKRRLPDPTSDGAAQPTLESLPESNVRRKLEELESEAHQHPGILKNSTDEINRCQADRPTPVDINENLPVELLTMIFGFLVTISPDELTRVRSVCRKWRAVSDESPELWSTLIISRDSEDDDASVERVKLYAERSTRPLRVSYTGSIGLSSQRRWNAWKTLPIHYVDLIKRSLTAWDALTIHHDEPNYGSTCTADCGSNCGSMSQASLDCLGGHSRHGMVPDASNS
ncbi:hypothetical protein JB92DRAFT_1965019 [Gautieria morchelliformis]|nr:hypothetical protein JB92DRAFT_1965019 [Gautieria morchelliformis]